MKLLTTNFLTCAVKTCKSSPDSFPLHFKDATLERTELDYSPLFLRNILPRVNWDALKSTAAELGLGALVPDVNPVEFEADTQGNEEGKLQQQLPSDDNDDEDEDVRMDVEKEAKTNNNNDDEEVLRKLHTLLLETAVVEGKLRCGNCGFEYPIKDGVGNFLLPAHLV